MSGQPQKTKHKPSKRDKRMKFFVYIMIAAMLIMTFSAGLSMIL